jgi:hypothetical protein
MKHSLEVGRPFENHRFDFQELFQHTSIQIGDTPDLYEEEVEKTEDGLLRHCDHRLSSHEATKYPASRTLWNSHHAVRVRQRNRRKPPLLPSGTVSRSRRDAAG